MKAYFYYTTDMGDLSEIDSEKLLNIINHVDAFSEKEINLQADSGEKILEIEIIPIDIYEVKKQTSLVKLDDK